MPTLLIHNIHLATLHFTTKIHFNVSPFLIEANPAAQKHADLYAKARPKKVRSKVKFMSFSLKKERRLNAA
jgi:hypothetical protein